MARTARLIILVLPALIAGCLSSLRPGPVLDPIPAPTLPGNDLPPLGAPALKNLAPGAALGMPVSADGTVAVAHTQAESTPEDEGIKPDLKLPPVGANDVPLPINLATALRLADARPLVVAAAQASAWVAEAQLLRAKLIWVPELDIDMLYLRHDGYGPDFFRGTNNPFSPTSVKLPLNQNINYFYGGGGLYAVFPVTDAIFKPLAARQVLDSKRWDIQAAKNDALLETARAYFEVHRARGMYAGTLDVVRRGQDLVRIVDRLTEEFVPKAESNRAKQLLAGLEQLLATDREHWRVASADMTQVLRLDPRAVVVPTEHDHLQISLIDPARPLEDLMPLAMRNRPELASKQATIQAAKTRIRMEKLRPLLPTILLTGFQTPGDMRMQFGLFALGTDGTFAHSNFRDDISLQVAWQLDSLGFGNLARVKEQRGEESKAIVELNRIQDIVVSEVTQSQARLQSATVRVKQAERSLRHTLAIYDKSLQGLAQTKRIGGILEQAYRPQEVVIALFKLRSAYDEYFKTVADYNMAQFELFHSLGYPAHDIARLWPPGEGVPVDTTRPSYLPVAGEGPPPATR